MSPNLPFVYFLALVWGVVWAVSLQWTAWGRWLAVKRTWITVVIGVGVDGLICLLVLPFDLWLTAATVVALSSVGIIWRSVVNEWRDEQ